jgi:hypothetical protein
MGRLIARFGMVLGLLLHYSRNSWENKDGPFFSLWNAKIDFGGRPEKIGSCEEKEEINKRRRR